MDLLVGAKNTFKGMNSIPQSIQSARLSVQSSELGPTPHPQSSVAPTLGLRGKTHSLEGTGVVGPNSDEWPETQVLLYCTCIL
jgi:hypothetical protein